ncbi:hypothetical protein GPECTOR_1g224 [Gonium pectorale]|uniref:PhoD-like phosphatase metallophosphatase domain-containing protein n=1 Tax=Gonium pectorale TaxID=33097 RepID=A0A150H277_GONPE|nr:hypothetical protein GPECTOR_1g224 [Gonium pectorale]|eukprot:KXZ56257.1 hypothetical protein GPECTOR_1g224 [Gonium pectorale]
MSYKGQCLAGNVDAARDRWDHVVHSSDYRAFLDYMCPPGPGGLGAALGRFPPIGTDPAVCPRPIFGVYDDHDFGWNNGNKRLTSKAEYKRMFLDAIGEHRDSSRRSADTGLQGAYTVNGGGSGRDIDLVLLDERWYRDTLPCELRRAWCEGILAQPDPDSPRTSWCQDFLIDDGATGRGSCCRKDEDLALWCGLPSSRDSPLWSAACDPTSSEWGSRQVVLGPDNATLLQVDEALWETQARELWPRLMQARDSPVCEVLGSAQREWLSRRLSASTAALTLVASGSVLLPSVGWQDPVQGACGGDDISCWKPAQLNLLHTLANVTSGCVVVLTGDFHFSDIKIVEPGDGRPYTELLQTSKMKRHVYQVMASGMTTSTAHHDGSPCAGTYREDLVGLRPLGNCSYMDGPNFGMLEVDWEQRVVHLTIRDASGGGIAVGLDGRAQHVAFALDTCAPVPL